MYAVAVAVLALAVAAQALPTTKLSARGGYGNGRYESVRNERLPTIWLGNDVHKSASLEVSRSRQDTFSNSESASLIKKHQDVVKSDTYIHRDTEVYKPLSVHHHNHHHQTDIVKTIQPVQNNEWVEEKQKIIAPEEAQVNTYSQSTHRETVVNPTIVNNSEKKIRLETIREPTKWVNAGGYEGSNRGEGKNEEYDR